MPVGRTRKSKIGTFPVTLRPHLTAASDEEGNTSEYSRPVSSSVYSTSESKHDNFYTQSHKAISNRSESDEHINSNSEQLNGLDLTTKLELVNEKDSSNV